jgi:hypothetical protein
MPTIKLAGRTDVEDYFERSGVFDTPRNEDTPFVVFVVRTDEIVVELVQSPAILLTYPDNTSVMRQWVTDETNDFFQFTVGLFRQHREARERQLRTAKNVVKVVGPRGGFRSLAYEYIDAAGVTVHVATGIRDEAERLEAFFKRSNIHVTVQTSH